MSSAPEEERELYGTSASVVAEEIRSLKPDAKVYERKAGLFFLSDKRTALQNAENAVEAAARSRIEGDDTRT